MVTPLKHQFHYQLANVCISVENKLQVRNLSSTGTILELRSRLDNHLKVIARQYTTEHIGTVILDNVTHPSALCNSEKCDIPYCFNERERNLCRIDLTFDGIGIKGEIFDLYCLKGAQKVRDMTESNDTSTRIMYT